MDFLDKAKDLAKEHGEKVGDVVDKIVDLVDEKTGGKHTDKIEAAAEKAMGFLGVDRGDGDDDKAGDGDNSDKAGD